MNALFILEYENRRVVFKPPFTQARIAMGVKSLKCHFGPAHHDAIDRAFKGLMQ